MVLVLEGEGWNPKILLRLPEAKANITMWLVGKEQKLREQKRLDTVVVLTVSYAEALFGIDQPKQRGEIRVRFWGEYGHKTET